MGSPLKVTQIKPGNAKEVWVSGNSIRGLDIDYPKLLLEKVNEIDRIKKQLVLSRDVINRQRRAIRKLTDKANPKKSIVADWLEPQPVAAPKCYQSENLTKPMVEEPTKYITIGE